MGGGGRRCLCWGRLEAGQQGWRDCLSGPRAHPQCGGALLGLPAVGVLGEVGRGQGLGPGVTR